MANVDGKHCPASPELVSAFRGSLSAFKWKPCPSSPESRTLTPQQRQEARRRRDEGATLKDLAKSYNKDAAEQIPLHVL